MRVSRTYRLPSDLAEWLNDNYTLYRMRDGTLANTKLDVVLDALERIRENEREYRLAARDLTSTAIHGSRAGTDLTVVAFKMPSEVVEWMEDYYRYHCMLDGTRAGRYIDLFVDALQRARKRSRH